MSGTGTGSSLVRINSDLMDSSFDTVPEAKEFQLRINASDGPKEYGYTLKKGKRLPYPVSFDGIYIYFEKNLHYHLPSGFKFEFTRHLRPTVAGFIGEEVDAWWVFDKEGKALARPFFMYHANSEIFQVKILRFTQPSFPALLMTSMTMFLATNH